VSSRRVFNLPWEFPFHNLFFKESEIKGGSCLILLRMREERWGEGWFRGLVVPLCFLFFCLLRSLPSKKRIPFFLLSLPFSFFFSFFLFPSPSREKKKEKKKRKKKREEREDLKKFFFWWGKWRKEAKSWRGPFFSPNRRHPSHCQKEIFFLKISSPRKKSFFF